MAKKRKTSLERARQKRLRELVQEDPETRESIEQLRDEFRAKFGRDPGPGDPLLFDPTKDEPTPWLMEDMQREFVAAVIRSGVNRGFAYAWVKSGYIVSEANHHLIPKAGIRAWNAAMAEWEAMGPEEQATTLQALLSPRPS